MRQYEEDAKRMFQAQFETGMTRPQAERLARRIAENYVEEAENFNRTRTADAPVVQTMPETLVFRDERPVKQLFWHEQTAEHDLQELYTGLDDYQKRMENEKSPVKIREAHDLVRAYETYVHRVMETIERDHYGTETPAPELEGQDRSDRQEFSRYPLTSGRPLNPALFRLIHPFVSAAMKTRSDWVDLLNKVVADPTGKSRFGRKIYLRDLHPQWYVGEREQRPPYIAAKAEMLRTYQTSKFLVDLSDHERLTDCWINLRMSHLKQMATRYRLVREDLARRLQKIS